MARKPPAPRSGAGGLHSVYILRQLHPQAIDHVGPGTGGLGGKGQAVGKTVICRPADSGVRPATTAGFRSGCPGKEGQHLAGAVQGL